MKTHFVTRLLWGLAALALLLPPVQAQVQVPVKPFDVYVDLPTGFVFVKLPAGWKFVGKVTEQDMASLPPAVITSLLASEPSELAAARPVKDMPCPPNRGKTVAAACKSLQP